MVVKTALVLVGFPMGLKCMNGIITKVGGMVLLPGGGQMDKRCMFVLTLKVKDLEKKQLGVRMALQSIKRDKVHPLPPQVLPGEGTLLTLVILNYQAYLFLPVQKVLNPHLLL